MIIPSWLSGSWRSFLCSFCIFLPPLLNIFCFCYVHTVSVLYCAHLCMKFPFISLIFFKRSLVFPILLFPSISLHYSLKNLPFISLLFFQNSAFKWVYCSSSPLHFASLLFSAICKASAHNHFEFLFLGYGFYHCFLYSVTNLHP